MHCCLPIGQLVTCQFSSVTSLCVHVNARVDYTLEFVFYTSFSLFTLQAIQCFLFLEKGIIIFVHNGSSRKVFYTEQNVAARTQCSTPARAAGTRLTYPGGMEGWVSLGLCVQGGDREQFSSCRVNAGRSSIHPDLSPDVASIDSGRASGRVSRSTDRQSARLGRCLGRQQTRWVRTARVRAVSWSTPRGQSLFSITNGSRKHKQTYTTTNLIKSIHLFAQEIDLVVNR